MRVKIKIRPSKGKHVTEVYHLEKGDRVCKESDMRVYAWACNVKVKRVVSQFVGMTAYELTGAPTRIRQVARRCIRWAL